MGRRKGSLNKKTLVAKDIKQPKVIVAKRVAKTVTKEAIEAPVQEQSAPIMSDVNASAFDLACRVVGLAQDYQKVVNTVNQLISAVQGLSNQMGKDVISLNERVSKLEAALTPNAKTNTPKEDRLEKEEQVQDTDFEEVIPESDEDELLSDDLI